MRIILASASPRRIELIKQIKGLQVTVFPSNINEQINCTDIKQMVIELAYQKASNVFSKMGILTLGADTVVSINNKVLGKPKTEKDAREYLRMLSGKTHEVYTGVCLINSNKIVKQAECTKVTFANLDENFISNYILSGSPFDKAGGYGIQDDMLSPMIEKIEGDINNVIGLPVGLLTSLIEENF